MNKIPKGSKKFSVSEIREKKNGFANPVLITFQNGELNDDKSEFNVKLNANDKGETNVEVKTSYGHKFQTVELHSLSNQKQIVAIRNRKTNKVKLIEVDSALLINTALLKPPEPNESEVVDVSADNRKRLSNLYKTFGGKRIVTRLEQREKLNLTSMPLTDEVQKVIEDVQVKENLSLNETELESIVHLLPPCHRDAKDVSEVYKLNEILSEEELQALKEEISSLEKKEFNPKEYSPFFGECYARVKKSKDGIDMKLAGLFFVECIIKFLKLPSKKLSAKTLNLCSFSSAIHEKLVSEFCNKTEASVTRPLALRDKSLCYIMAVSLICCDYQINLKFLSTSTAVHFVRLTRLARVVGAVPSPKDENVFALKLPLPSLPKSSKAKIRRKKG